MNGDISTSWKGGVTRGLTFRPTLAPNVYDWICDRIRSNNCQPTTFELHLHGPKTEKRFKLNATDSFLRKCSELRSPFIREWFRENQYLDWAYNENYRFHAEIKDDVIHITPIPK